MKGDWQLVKIEAGQVWRRINGGKRVRIIAYDRDFDDVLYERIDGTKGRGNVYGSNLRLSYDLIEPEARREIG